MGKEINTMIDIRREVFRRYPYTKLLIKPTTYTDVRGIKLNDEITSAVKFLNKKDAVCHAV